MELKAAQPELCDELGIVVLEQRAGRPRGDAWKHLAERTDVDCVRNLVSMLVQADQFGTSIAKTLRVHSDTLRTQRVQAVEEAAAKTTIKLLFPLVLFIFPSLFVVTLGPAFISIMDSFASLKSLREGGIDMNSTTIIQIVAGVLAVVVLIVLIQRRRTRVK